MGFIEGTGRAQASLLPGCIDEHIAFDSLADVDAFADTRTLAIRALQGRRQRAAPVTWRAENLP